MSIISTIRSTVRKIYFGVVRTIHSPTVGPGYIGRTFAVGFFAGMLVPMGQSIVCIAIWLVVDKWLGYKFNIVLACLATLISNPLTTPFWFYLFYLTGQPLLGGAKIPFGEFLGQVKPLLADVNMETFLQTLALLAKGVGMPIVIGSLVWHIIMIFVGYFVGVRIYYRIDKLIQWKKARKDAKHKVSK